MYWIIWINKLSIFLAVLQKKRKKEKENYVLHDRRIHLGHILVFIFFFFDMHMVDLVLRNDNGWCRLRNKKKIKNFNLPTFGSFSLVTLTGLKLTVRRKAVQAVPTTTQNLIRLISLRVSDSLSSLMFDTEFSSASSWRSSF